jgi:hypothetical protein
MMDDRRFRQAFQKIVDEAPEPPGWGELTSKRRTWSDFVRRPTVAFVAGALFVLVVIGITALVSGDTPPPAAGTSSTTSTMADTATPTTTESGLGIEQMACGAAAAPYSLTIPEASELNQDAREALAALEESGEGSSFADAYEFRLWSQDGDELVLLGYPRDPGQAGYADAHFELRGGEWIPTGFGQCRWQPVVEGYGLATWRVTGDIDPESSTFTVMATERNCAGGQAPTDRKVTDAVIADELTATVFVLVEPVQGDATCPGNPEFEHTVTLTQPIGDRVLLDGSESPPAVRYQPSTSGCRDRTEEVGVEYMDIYVFCHTGDGLEFRAIPRALDDDTVVSFAGLLHEVLRGLSEEELSDGYISVFSETTADALESAEVDGTMAVIDFNDSILIENGSTTTGGAELQAALLQNVFSVDQLESVEFRVNGSCEAWSNFLQDTGCRVYTRDDLLALLDQLG